MIHRVLATIMIHVLLLPLTLALIVSLLFFRLLVLVKHEPAGLPNGSMGLPFVGESFSFFKPHKSISIGTFLQDHRSRYGKVFKSSLLGSPTIVSCDLEFTTFVLQNEDKLFRSSYPKSVRNILGKGSVLFATGDRRKKLRNIEVNLINNCKRKLDFLRLVENLCISSMESWRSRNQPLLFSAEAKQFSVNLMLMNLLDTKAGEPLAVQLLEDFLSFTKGFVSIPINLPWTSYGKAVKARIRTLSNLKQVLKDREKRKDAGLLNEISILQGNLSDLEKASVLLDILWGGYETTSGLLSLLVYFLAHSPPALQNLKDEHRGLRRKKKEGEPLNWEDYKHMEFTIMVINETLRCGNVVKFVHRKAIKDVEFKGYHIPAGWKVYPIFSAVHLDPSLHENPSEFNPWRWIDSATSKKVMPFGGGQRMCPGMELAKLEAAFFLHHLVINYTWTTKEDDYPMFSPLLEFKRGLQLTLKAETSQI